MKFIAEFIVLISKTTGSGQKIVKTKIVRENAFMRVWEAEG